MRHYIGVDIIEIGRVKEVLARWGDTFLRRIYTEAELALYREKPPSLAARFACKEAVMKLLGTGRRGVSWREVEVLSRPGGQPRVNLYGRALGRADKLGIREVAVSLSHCRDYAVASVSAVAGTDKRHSRISGNG